MKQQHATAQPRWKSSPRHSVLALALATCLLFLWGANAQQCTMTVQPSPNITAADTYTDPLGKKDGALPLAGNCISWTLLVNSTGPCADTVNRGQMQLELWILDSLGNAVDPRTTLPGIYLAITRNTDAPTTTVLGGGTSFQPSLAFGPDPTYLSTYIDMEAVLAQSGNQRVIVPMGDFVNSGAMVDFFTWKMSLSNMNPDLPTGLRRAAESHACVWSGPHGRCLSSFHVCMHAGADSPTVPFIPLSPCPLPPNHEQIRDQGNVRAASRHD
jgi:hypothetical protein